MSDQPPVQQVVAPVQQDKEDWRERYTGSSRIINQRDDQIKILEAELAGKVSESEQLRSQLGVKDVEKSVAITSYQTQLQVALDKTNASEVELKELRAFKAKYDLALSLKDQRILPLLPSIPYVENPETMKQIMTTFMDWGDGLVRAREKELLSGVVPPPLSVPIKAGPSFSTKEEWQKHVDGLVPGTQEKADAMKAWWAWGATQK